MSTSAAAQPRTAKPRQARERRGAPRMRVDAPAELRLCPATSRTTPVRVKVSDVSSTGLGILHESPLPVGQKCVVKTPTLPSDQACLYTVVRAVPLGAGAFHIGLHLSQLIDGLGFAALPPVKKPAGLATKLAIALLILALAGVAASFFLPPISQLRLPWL